MRAHLHLHLEPEVRKRRQLGRTLEQFKSPDTFFHSHKLSARGRTAVSATDLTEFIRDLCQEQAAQGIGYVEIRLSPRRFLHDGLTWQGFFDAASTALKLTRNPVVRGILLLNRDSSVGFIGDVNAVIQAGLPPEFVGIDIAGDERAFPTAKNFASVCASARAAGLGITVHAGEFGGVASVWEALDELGAHRIGHSLAAVEDRALMARLSGEGLPVEVSLSSSAALGSTRRFATHPVRLMWEAGIRLSFNTDVPLHTGASLAEEADLARALLGIRESGFADLQRAAMGHAFIPPVARSLGSQRADSD